MRLQMLAAPAIGSVAALLGAALPAAAETSVLGASRDASVYAESGDLANGAGSYIHAGRNNSAGDERRALIAFDLSTLPADATITGATLTLFVSATGTGDLDIELHRVLSAWVEGSADPGGGEGGGTAAGAGDVTWTHRAYDATTWASPGGDFEAAASAIATAGDAGAFYSWSSAAMVADVQSWVNAPAQNHGWILIAPGAAQGQAKRMDSRHSGAASQRPSLQITFTSPSTTGACCLADGSCAVVNSPGDACTGNYQGDSTGCVPNTCPQPVGACCTPDASAACSEKTEAVCTGGGGRWQGAMSACEPSPCPVVLSPYVDPLPVPPVAQPVSGSAGKEASYVISAVELWARLHSELPPTRVWGYDDGTGPRFPGPTVEAQTQAPVTVTWRNELRDAAGDLRVQHLLPVDDCVHGADSSSAPKVVTHLHGGHVAAASDGFPEDAVPPGQELVYEYPNWQQAATLWYHDHALGITRLNVHLGLFGLYLIRDPVEEALGLPSGAYDVPLVIVDRSFNPDGSLRYPGEWQPHFFGDTILVNGVVWPYFEVDRGLYRFRVLNGSGSRHLTLALSDSSAFQIIATDGGLLEAPVEVKEVTLAPAERVDMLVDFSGYDPGKAVQIVNSAPAPFPGQAGAGVVPEVMEFRVGASAGFSATAPGQLGTLPPISIGESTPVRDFVLERVADDSCGDGSSFLINGRRWADIDEYPTLGEAEVWRFINRTGLAHPMHVHLDFFRILDRQGFEVVAGEIVPTTPKVPPAPEEAGWKDTVRVGPHEIVRVAIRFRDFTGRFVYHCHILEHEDHDMMRQFETVTECGDGARGLPEEECDDGNTTPGDGCSAQCTLEDAPDAGMADGDAGGVGGDSTGGDAGTGARGGSCDCRTGGNAGSGGLVLLVLAAVLFALRRR